MKGQSSHVDCLILRSAGVRAHWASVYLNDFWRDKKRNKIIFYTSSSATYSTFISILICAGFWCIPRQNRSESSENHFGIWTRCCRNCSRVARTALKQRSCSFVQSRPCCMMPNDTYQSELDHCQLERKANHNLKTARSLFLETSCFFHEEISVINVIVKGFLCEFEIAPHLQKKLSTMEWQQTSMITRQSRCFSERISGK